MKYLRQFCIILLVSALGEGLHILLPLPVPASVYGLVLMLGALASGILKLEQVEDKDCIKNVYGTGYKWTEL